MGVFILKIGIIIYSQTEHTYSVAQKLQDKFIASGHDANLERILITEDSGSGSKKFEFKSQPDVNIYDALIFGAPVHAFSLAPPMKAYLEQIKSLENKKVACFVTKGAPFHWTGGKQAVAKMKKICKSKGGSVIATGIIVWRGSREKEIVNFVNKLVNLY
jgi:NAD(P)H dehydrogenase (quinone)